MKIDRVFDLVADKQSAPNKFTIEMGKKVRAAREEAGLLQGELAQMVELYAKAQLPYPREQTVVDFHVLARAEGFSTVAVIACQREVVNRYLGLLQDAGLPATLLTVSSWGVLGWYQQLLRRGTKVQEPALIEEPREVRPDAGRLSLQFGLPLPSVSLVLLTPRPADTRTRNPRGRA